MPGPGAYTLAGYDDARNLNGVSSAFVSASSRLQLETTSSLGIVRPPGPAFYPSESEQKTYDRKHFNLNARKRWI